jgi:hypothetical protein
MQALAEIRLVPIVEGSCDSLERFWLSKDRVRSSRLMAALCTWTRFHFDKLGWARLSTVDWNGSSLEVAAPERDETVIE